MADQSLFTSQTPAGNAQDGGSAGVVTALSFMVTADGVIKGVRFWAHQVTSGDTYRVDLWQLATNTTAVGGVPLATKSVLGSALGSVPGWQVVLFDTPVAVTTGVVYRASMHNNHFNPGASEEGRYVYTLNFWASGGLTNGNIVGVQDGVDPGVGFTVSNGTSAVNQPAGSFPSNAFSSTNYFIDVVYTADGGSTDYPVSGTIAATSTAALAITADRPVSGAIPATSTAALAITAGRLVSGTIAGSSTASLAITAARAVSGTIAAVSTASLALTGSAVVYVKRGGVAVLVTGLAGACKRGGVITPFGT